MNKFLPFLFWVLVASLSSCYYDNEEELYPEEGFPATSCDTANVSYQQAVLPILDANCLSCHDAASASGGINLEGHANVVRQANAGRLLGSISHSPGFSPMPRNGNKLPDCEILTIEAWISQGTQNN